METAKCRNRTKEAHRKDVLPLFLKNTALSKGAEGSDRNELLLGFFDGNGHGDSHADHGVVTCAQEAHHFDVKSACRRLCACGAGTFRAGSPTFSKTRSTSHESRMLCFPSWAFLTTSSVQETICLSFLYKPFVLLSRVFIYQIFVYCYAMGLSIEN